MCISQTYKASSGAVMINTANSALNGTGTLGTVLVSDAASNGTNISLITIKALGSTQEGMIRLFINDTVNKKLIMEVIVPGNTQTGVVPAFGSIIPMNLNLAPGYSLLASTQIGNSFVVSAFGRNWTNCNC